MLDFIRRFLRWARPLSTGEQRIDALTFAVIRGEMTIQELQVKVQEQANTISNLEVEARNYQRALTTKLKTQFLIWEEVHEELQREDY